LSPVSLADSFNFTLRSKVAILNKFIYDKKKLLPAMFGTDFSGNNFPPFLTFD